MNLNNHTKHPGNHITTYHPKHPCNILTATHITSTINIQYMTIQYILTKQNTLATTYCSNFLLMTIQITVTITQQHPNEHPEHPGPGTARDPFFYGSP